MTIRKQWFRIQWGNCNESIAAEVHKTSAGSGQDEVQHGAQRWVPTVRNRGSTE